MPGPYSWKNILRGAFAAQRDGGLFWKAASYTKAFQAEDDAQASRSYPRPSRDWGYYSKSKGDRIDVFIGRDGDITAERPHVHMIQNSPSSDYIFVATDARGRHSGERRLPAQASGNEVNAAIAQLLKLIR